jgi:hypothetical protein
MQHDHGVSVRLPAVLRRPRSDAESERHVGHGHDDDPVPRLGVLGDSREGGLGHGVAEEEGALGVGLEPDAAPRVGREEVERVDGEVERAVVGEPADGRAHAGEARARDGGGAADEGLGGVVDAVAVEAEAVAAGLRVRALDGGPLQEVLQVGPRELEQLLEYLGGLLLVERPHGAAALEDGGRRRRVTDWGRT